MNALPTLLRRRPATPRRPRTPYALDARVQRVLARTAHAWGLAQHAGAARHAPLLAMHGEAAH